MCVCVCVCVCVYKQFQLDRIRYLLSLYLLPSCTPQTLISSQRAPLMFIHPLPAPLIQPAASPPPSPTSFFTPLLLSWDEVPSAPPAPPAHLAVISSRPVRWCEISPRHDQISRKSLVPSLYIIFFVYTSRHKENKPDMRNWDAELVSVSHWLTSDFIFLITLFFIAFGCRLGKHNLYSLPTFFFLTHTNTHPYFSSFTT